MPLMNMQTIVMQLRRLADSARRLLFGPMVALAVKLPAPVKLTDEIVGIPTAFQGLGFGLTDLDCGMPVQPIPYSRTDAPSLGSLDPIALVPQRFGLWRSLGNCGRSLLGKGQRLFPAETYLLPDLVNGDLNPVFWDAGRNSSASGVFAPGVGSGRLFQFGLLSVDDGVITG